jgi:formylglycine-generating enzyme required for sulfatase activity
LNPYRAAGTFTGLSYIEREADKQLRTTIDQNQRYPYLLAPRQSGKSSLILHTIKILNPEVYRCAFIDLSTLPNKALDDYDIFLNEFITTCARSLGVMEKVSTYREFPKFIDIILKNFKERIVIFIDEIDTISNATFNDPFLSLIRSIYNQRASKYELTRIQFILSGATQPTHLITDPFRSPFNVGVAIKLSDLTLAQISSIASHLQEGGTRLTLDTVHRIYDHTHGSVYLTQLILENLWERRMLSPSGEITPEDVDAVVESVIAEAADNMHFTYMYKTIIGTPTVQQAFAAMLAGQHIDGDILETLRLIGIVGDKYSFRNALYERVFGAGGPLDVISPRVTEKPWSLGLALGLFIVARFPRLARCITRLILGPPPLPAALPTLFRGPHAYGPEARLPGRQKECADCWQQLREATFFILEGESGCGKSSFLHAALLPQAQQEFRVVVCRLAEDPLGKLCAALRQEPYRLLPTPLTALAEALASANVAVRPKPLLLCIDQAEELFVTVRDEVREQCLSVLKDAIATAQLRLLITIRSDFRDLLDRLCRSLDPQQQTLDLGSYYTLRAFRAGPARAVLDEILRPASDQSPLLRQQLDDFAGALVADLLRSPRDPRLYQADEKTVLPVELQTVGMMLESVGLQQVSVAGLQRQGGKAGLMRAYIEDAKTYAWHKTGVPLDQTVFILRQLISPARTKWAQTASAIGQALGMPAVPVAQVLDAFAEKYLVNRLPADFADGNGADQPTAQRYELMHEYLMQILAEAPDPALQKAQDAAERLRFWEQRSQAAYRHLSRGRALLAQPIPLVESLRLWRYARRGDERRMLWRNLRGFGMRLALVIVLLSPGWGYLSMEFVRWTRDMGALVVHNPVGATLTLHCIRHYADTKACSPDERPLQGSSVYLRGPADYVLTAHFADPVGQVRYPVYIQGYGHRVTVTVVHPPKHLPEGMEGMVYIPGGIFRMGDKDATDGMGGPEEVPAHNVEVDGFVMDQYEVSNKQYAQCVAHGQCAGLHYEDETCIQFTPKGWKKVRVGDDFREDTKPVVCVTWEEAKAYCEYRHKRLPTEAEWEKAAAGPEGYIWSFGNPPFDGTKANYCDDNCDLPWTSAEGGLPSLLGNDEYATTAPVGTYPPNGYGLYDMSGNVAEWVADWYDKEFYQKPEALRRNPENRNPDSLLRVVRGQSWADVPSALRVAARGRNDPTGRSVSVGFRCVAPRP